VFSGCREEGLEEGLLSLWVEEMELGVLLVMEAPVTRGNIKDQRAAKESSQGLLYTPLRKPQVWGKDTREREEQSLGLLWARDSSVPTSQNH
jgi:hypothetical protein